MEFLLIHPNDLRNQWPRISDSLDAVLAKAEEDWIKEDVFHAIKAGHAACHYAIDESGFAGLLITTKAVSEFSRTPSIHVWIAHNVGSADVIEGGLSLLRQVAQQAGASRITFASPRVGWAKRHKLISATYEVSL